MEQYEITKNAESNRLINKIIYELKDFSDSLILQMKKLTDIGRALSSETQIPRLLEMIVDLAGEFTNSEGGTLYTVSPDRNSLFFETVQNTSLKVRMGGTGGEITWPAVRLKNEDGKQNHTNVSAHVAITGEIVNIPDVYDAEGFDFKGTKEFDKRNKYRSKSMLVVPLMDHENEIIGVLQLLNAKSTLDNSIISFSPEAQAMTLSLASQAAVTLTKNRLIRELEILFESFIRTIAKAIDEKSPYTGGHVRRVAEIVMMIAEGINEKKEGSYKDISFTKDQLKELRIAAWMHDIGKVTTPEYVVDKSTKLETIFDRIEVIRTRFEVVKRDREIAFLRKKAELSENGQSDRIADCEVEFAGDIKKIDDDMQFLEKMNIGGEFMSHEHVKRVEDIAKKTWVKNGEPCPLLSKNEVYNFSIRKGTLTDEERQTIQNHVRLTEAMLKELPFPKKLKNVPEYAAGHHETLIGTGYHKGLKGDQIKLQTRILALSDIFEALSASDRPYKKGKTMSEVVKILGFMVKDQHIDKDLFDLFITEKLFHKYVKAEYKPNQIDIPLE